MVSTLDSVCSMCRCYVSLFDMIRWGRSFYMEKLLNSVLMEDRKVYEQPINLPKLVDQLSNKTLAYLDKVQNSSDPFAIYFAFPNVHTPLVPNKRFRGKSKFGPYGDR